MLNEQMADLIGLQQCVREDAWDRRRVEEWAADLGLEPLREYSVETKAKIRVITRMITYEELG